MDREEGEGSCCILCLVRRALAWDTAYENLIPLWDPYAQGQTLQFQSLNKGSGFQKNHPVDLTDWSSCGGSCRTGWNCWDSGPCDTWAASWLGASRDIVETATHGGRAVSKAAASTGSQTWGTARESRRISGFAEDLCSNSAGTITT